MSDHAWGTDADLPGAPEPTEKATAGRLHFEPCYDSEYECKLHKAAPWMVQTLRLIAAWEGVPYDKGSHGAQQHVRELARTALRKAGFE